MCCVLALAVAQLRADQPADIRSAIEIVATGLSAGNPADAISVFDKSYANYDKLSSYFGGLTSAFHIVNEVDVVDENDSEAATTVTVHWTITLSNLATNFSERREADIHAHLVLKERKWKIVDFTPIAIFNPQPPLRSK